MACTCEKQEIGTGRGEVKGYITVTECAECIAQRETDATAQAAIKVNEDARLFLNASDWKVIRHRDQLAQDITTSLTSEEYTTLLSERQTQRELVVE